MHNLKGEEEKPFTKEARLMNTVQHETLSNLASVSLLPS